MAMRQYYTCVLAPSNTVIDVFTCLGVAETHANHIANNPGEYDGLGHFDGISVGRINVLWHDGFAPLFSEKVDLINKIDSLEYGKMKDMSYHTLARLERRIIGLAQRVVDGDEEITTKGE